jgi:hypothetical protein
LSVTPGQTHPNGTFKWQNGGFETGYKLLVSAISSVLLLFFFSACALFLLQELFVLSISKAETIIANCKGTQQHKKKKTDSTQSSQETTARQHKAGGKKKKQSVVGKAK